MRISLALTIGCAVESRRQPATPGAVRTSKVATLLAVAGLVLLLIQLTGCASAPLDETKYNDVTGYPAVGADGPLH
jgi:hypothetical protein